MTTPGNRRGLLGLLAILLGLGFVAFGGINAIVSSRLSSHPSLHGAPVADSILCGLLLLVIGILLIVSSNRQ